MQVIDSSTGACVDWFRIDGAVGEHYGLGFIEGYASPMAVPPHSAEAAILITIAS